MNRPVYLNLAKIKLPVSGVVSIFHRLSGFALILGLPALIGILTLSLQSESSFTQVQTILIHPIAKLIQVILAWAIIHHILAGIRFLLIDIHIGVDKKPATTSSYFILILSALSLIAFFAYAFL